MLLGSRGANEDETGDGNMSGSHYDV